MCTTWQDTNHSLRVNIDNQSGYDIDSVILFSLVYNQDGQVIDILIGGLGSHQNFPNGESRLVAARSHTITGRCVDFSSPYEPFSIRYFLLVFNYEQLQMGRWEGEFHID